MKTLAAALVALSLAAPVASHAGPNLLPNPSFESSVLEPTPALAGVLPQPVLPTGWIFEGAAGLFDHSPNQHHSGARSIAISAPASSNESYCIDQADDCVQNPINDARDELRPTYSLTPHWRTIDPVTVTAGKTYELSVFVELIIVTVGEGVTTRVRWLDAGGSVISESVGPKRIQQPDDPESILWGNAPISKELTAPTGARGAIVMLGHTDDLWIGQVVFDDVSFREV